MKCLVDEGMRVYTWRKPLINEVTVQCQAVSMRGAQTKDHRIGVESSTAIRGASSYCRQAQLEFLLLKA